MALGADMQLIAKMVGWLDNKIGNVEAWWFRMDNDQQMYTGMAIVFGVVLLIGICGRLI